MNARQRRYWRRHGGDLTTIEALARVARKERPPCEKFAGSGMSFVCWRCLRGPAAHKAEAA